MSTTAERLRLRGFGVPIIERPDGTPLDGAARQRRVIALLSIVAAGGRRGISRDRVLALLWSESEPDRAKQALTQSMYHARKALGVDNLFVASADLRLNRDVITSDVNEFDEARAAGELMRAASLYQGPYLDGFYVSGAPEFERWVTQERARLRDECARALEALATAASNRAEHACALEWWKRLAALDPLDSRYALGTMRAMAAAGDAAGAVRHAHAHEQLVQEELQAVVDPAVDELAARLKSAPIRAAVRSPRSPDVAQSPAHALPTVAQVLPNASGFSARRRVLVAGALVLAATVLLATVLVSRRAEIGDSEPHGGRMVVIPFRVAGADPGLAYLREGLVDLLLAKLEDDSATHVADAGAVMTAWKSAGLSDRADVPARDVLQIARQLGGTRVLMGSVVGTPASLVVIATLLSVPDGSVRAHASAGGPADSLTTILDRLVARLLAREAGEWDRLASRTSTSILALRAYLDGQAAHRRGQYREAVRLFRTALERDASFAMAGLSLAMAADRIGSSADRARGLAVAWAARAELALRDSVYLTALAGPRYPEESSPREQFSAWEQAAAFTPDRAEVWHELGERLLLDGELLALGNWPARAAAAFRRAAALDPGLASPWQYLMLLAAATNDSVGVRQAATAYMSVDSIGDLSPFVRWRHAVARGDSAALRRLRRSFASFASASLRAIVTASQAAGVAMEDAEAAQALLLSRAVHGRERTDALLATHALAQNMGKTHAAHDATAALADESATRALALRLRVLDALYGGGDADLAKDAAASLSETSARWRTASATQHGRRVAPNEAHIDCVVGQWLTWSGSDVDSSYLLQAARSGQPPVARFARACTALLDAIVATRQRLPNVSRSITQFDSMLVALPRDSELWDYGGLALARLYSALDDTTSAFAAVRRRPNMRSAPRYLAASLLEEARLAAATGDTGAARRAYAHYLALRRFATDAAARDEAERARTELESLLGSPISRQ